MLVRNSDSYRDVNLINMDMKKIILMLGIVLLASSSCKQLYMDKIRKSGTDILSGVTGVSTEYRVLTSHYPILTTHYSLLK